MKKSAPLYMGCGICRNFRPSSWQQRICDVEVGISRFRGTPEKIHETCQNILRIIPVQVPAIESYFMSMDEIARIFSKFQSSYIGGEIGIFSSPRAYKERERLEFFQVPRPWEEFGIFEVPEPIQRGRDRNFSKSQGLGRSSEFIKSLECEENNMKNMKDV